MKKFYTILLIGSCLFGSDVSNQKDIQNQKKELAKLESAILPPLKDGGMPKQEVQQKQDVSVENLVKILNATDEKQKGLDTPPRPMLETQNLKLSAIGFSQINGVKKALILDGTSPVYVKQGDIYKGLKINEITKDCIFVGDGAERLYYITRNDIRYMDSKVSK